MIDHAISVGGIGGGGGDVDGIENSLKVTNNDITNIDLIINNSNNNSNHSNNSSLSNSALLSNNNNTIIVSHPHDPCPDICQEAFSTQEEIVESEIIESELILENVYWESVLDLDHLISIGEL